MIIGNSHSVDAFQLLFELFKSQNPEKEMMLGILYYSELMDTGCDLAGLSVRKNNGRLAVARN